MVCFDSSLFHATHTPLRFRKEWQHRRISVTYLFGHRLLRPIESWPYMSAMGIATIPAFETTAVECEREAAMASATPAAWSPAAGGR